MSITVNYIVLNWLNNELNLNPNVDNIHMEFQNGYRFADILISLKLISKKEFYLFKNSQELEEIKGNFLLLKNYLHKLLNLEVRFEEFNEIINNDKYKSTIIIYRIKNAFYKTKIHFNEIKTSIAPPSKEEIEQKIKIIMESTFGNEKDENKNNNELNNINNSNIRNLRKEKSCKTILSHNININLKKPDKVINPINILKNKNSESKKIILPLINNKNRRYENENGDSKNDKIKLLTKNKSQENLNMNKYSSLSFDSSSNIFNNEPPLDRNRLTNNLIQYGISYENIKNNNSINELFNNKKKEQKENNKDSARKKILFKKINDSAYDVPEINFIKKDKKFLDNITNILNNKKNAFSSLENNFILYNRIDNSKYKTSFKRKEYSKMREKEVDKEKFQKRLFFFNKLFISHQRRLNLSQKNIFNKANPLFSNILLENRNEIFDKEKYFEEINKLNYIEYNEYCKKRYDIFSEHYSYMKNIILLIFDITMEGYFYQKEHKTDVLNMKFYLKLIKLFLKNKKLRRPKIDNEYEKLKQMNKLEDNIDIDNIILSEDEKFLLKDYLYYIGFWSKEKITDNELIGKKLDYKLILVDKIKNLGKFEEYEPTETENEDLTLPKNNINDFNYGDLILEIIENRYSNKKDITNNLEKNLSKWNYIPYKISLIGYPFSGKKYISEKIIKKYPNLKIYSIQKILREYISHYKKISEPIENLPKFKSMKHNQIEQLKQEKQKELDEFEPILKIIKPYIDLMESNEKNEKKDDICIPQDEVLLNILIYTIEKDFPKIDRKEIDDEINENKKKIDNLLSKIEAIENSKNEKKEKEKEKSRNAKIKQKDKDEITIQNYENEIQSIKTNSIKGFILADFPTNFNQCYLLENYLTGYIDELQKPKTLKNKMIQKLNNIMDIRYLPNENKAIKKAGIDFIINIKLKEEDVNNRFNDIKYDPDEDKIYTQDEYDQINNKKILERITNKIPYYTASMFNYYKQEYEDNISQINLFYSKFGFVSNENSNIIGTSLFTTENDQNIKTIKVYQSIAPDKLIQTSSDLISIQNENKEKVEKKKKIPKNNKPKKIKENKKVVKSENKNKSNNNENKTDENNLSTQEKNEQIANHCYEYIISKIQLLYEENNKTEKQSNKESNKDSEEQSISRNEIRKSRTKKQTALTIENEKILLNIKIKSENIIKEILSLDGYYNENLRIFIYLLNKQKFDIYDRLNLIQRKFRDFLNRQTEKKKFIHTYVAKYNKFFKTNPNLFLNENVTRDFSNDIEDINISLWTILINKKSESIYELQEIKNCAFVEIELCKFFNHMKELFLLEAHKFLGMINIILDFYIKNILDERISFIKKNISSNTNNNINQIFNLRNKINEYFDNKKFKEEFIFNDLISINEVFLEEKKILDNTDNVSKTDKQMYSNSDIEQNNIDTRSKYTIFSDNIISILIKNINTLFFNSIHLLINQNEKIIPFLKILSEISNILNRKPKAKAKKSQLLVNETISSNSSIFNNNSQKEYNIIISEENIKKIIQNEKNKFKYRLCFLKSFSTKFILIISQINQKIFHNADDWIIKSINMENDAQNEVINLLKNKLQEKKLIDEENEINTIEMDSFEKIIDEDSKSNKSIDLKIKPIDNSSVMNCVRIYNKINIDFLVKDTFFDIKFEQNEKNEKTEEQNEKSEKNEENIIYNIDDMKQYKIIFPNNISNCISGELSERSQATNEEEIIKEEEFYYDINKFYGIYKKIKKFEIDKNIVSYDNFYEAFIKKYIIYNKGINKINSLENNIELNNIEESNKNKNIKLNSISFILKKINSKQIKRMMSFYQIHIDKNEEDKEDNEYDDYIKLDEIFTILSLIGCDILTKEKEEKIMNDLKDKLIHGKYLSKNEFMNYQFWFEKNLEYQNLMNSNEKEIKEEEVNDKLNIKNFLYELWKDEMGSNINMKKFIDILKVSNYITDISEYNNKKYYDIIFYD